MSNETRFSKTTGGQPTPLQTREQAINNNPCGICRGMRFPPPCKGHGGKGGGGGGGGSAETSDDDKAVDKDEMKSNPAGSSELSRNIEISPPQLKPDLLFMREILSELLQDGRLLIALDQEKGKLTIQCDASLLNVDEQGAVDAYANSILEELDAFKQKHQLEKPCYQLELDRNGHLKSLTITLPTPGLYDAFIQQLNHKALLPNQNKQFPAPMPSSTTRKKEEEQTTSWKPPTPSPFKD